MRGELAGSNSGFGSARGSLVRRASTEQRKHKAKRRCQQDRRRRQNRNRADVLRRTQATRRLFRGREKCIDRQPAHFGRGWQQTATSNCVLSIVSGKPRSARTARQNWIAARAFLSAASLVLPWLTQVRIAGTSTTQAPVSSRLNVTVRSMPINQAQPQLIENPPNLALFWYDRIINLRRRDHLGRRGRARCASPGPGRTPSARRFLVRPYHRFAVGPLAADAIASGAHCANLFECQLSRRFFDATVSSICHACLIIEVSRQAEWQGCRFELSAVRSGRGDLPGAVRDEGWAVPGSVVSQTCG